MKYLFAILFFASGCMMKAMEQQPLTPVEAAASDMCNIDRAFIELSQHIKESERLMKVIHGAMPFLEHNAMHPQFKKFFASWLRKSGKCQKRLADVCEGLSRFIDTFQPVPIQEQADGQGANNYALITESVDNFVHNLYVTLLSFEPVWTEICEIKRKSEKEGTIPLHATEWHESLSMNEEFASQLSFKVYMLSELTKKLSQYPGPREIRESPF